MPSLLKFGVEWIDQCSKKTFYADDYAYALLYADLKCT